MNGFSEMITSEFATIFRETFESGAGHYLERETSILETIKKVTHEEASKPTSGGDETIAGHISHTIFYIRVLKDYISGRVTGNIDWEESWVIKKVTQQEWDSLKEELKKEYKELQQYIQSIKEWSNEDLFGGLLAVLAHCAYHLGAIRQNIK